MISTGEYSFTEYFIFFLLNDFKEVNFDFMKNFFSSYQFYS